MAIPDTRVENAVQQVMHSLDDSDAALDALMDRIGDARFVLLGEASHGTSEYYTWRARITRRLILEKGFKFLGVEGDWPDCYQVNRYIKGYADSGSSARDVLHAFNRWPTWMWANWEIVALVEWLKRHNADQPDHQKFGFYGLDMYSLWESMQAIMDYLQKNEGEEALNAAHQALTCFQPYNRDPQNYAYAASFTPNNCQDAVIKLLTKMRQQPSSYDGDGEAAFSADQNALVAVNAEHYYRKMVQGGAETWNIRDNHMMETLRRLADFYGPDSKGIVWEHNTHIGDATATDMAAEGMVNIGQLARMEYGMGDTVLVGFGSYQGTVIAGEQWGAPIQVMEVPPGREGSWERILHEIEPKDKLLILSQPDQVDRHEASMDAVRGHRAIGVVYRPEYERYGNYVPTVLPHRYDAFLFIDQTKALHPLHIKPSGNNEPDLYPWGF
jgi:erythromycin esterase